MSYALKLQRTRQRWTNKLPDQSSLDQHYFIDEHVYNCPFCNRGHVSYSVVGVNPFDWTNSKRCYAYFIRCRSCEKISMHLSYTQIPYFEDRYSPGGFNLFDLTKVDGDLDNQFFYSVPTSFFVLDPRIPRNLRELLTEAEGSLKSNFLTGASACARKIVYELTKDTEISNYEDRIKSLKEKRQDVDEFYFDTLLTIQQTTSSKVHEKAFDRWEARHLRVILAALREILHVLFVEPALKENRRKGILDLKKEVLEEGGS